MPDYKSAHHQYRRPRYRRKTLAEWENEGGSLCRPSVEPPASEACPGHSSLEFALLDVLPLGTLVTNAAGEIVYSNPASQKLYESSASELLGTRWSQAIDARDRPDLLSRWEEDTEAARPGTFEVRLITGSGRRIWTRHSIARLGRHQVAGDHIHTIEDISGIRAAEQAREDTLEALSRERERARVTLECIGDAVISTDARGQVTYLNRVAETLTGWRREDACGQPLSRVFRVNDAASGKPIDNLAERAMESLEVVQMPANSLLLRPDGSELAIEDSAAPILDRSGRLTGAVVIFRDRNLSQENITRMAHLARHDALTGLANRVSFAEHFDGAIRLSREHGNRVGLLFIDLDNFKQVNDSLGHKEGDRILKELSRSLASCVRSTDLVCRYGGDEFIVLLSEIKHPEDAGRVAMKLRAAASRPRQIQGCPIGLKLSVGISLYPDHGTEMATLMHRADAAMYHAKIDSEMDYCFYEPRMERPADKSRLKAEARASGSFIR